MGVEVATDGRYPGPEVDGALGPAVGLPLGVHRKTGRRYPLFDAAGLPCTFTATEKAAAFVLGVTRARAAPLRERWHALVATRKAERTKRAQQAEQVRAVGVREVPDAPQSPRAAQVGPPVATRP